MDGKSCSGCSAKVESIAAELKEVKVEVQVVKLQFTELSHKLVELEAKLSQVKADCKDCTAGVEKQAKSENNKGDNVDETLEPQVHAPAQEQAKTDEEPVEVEQVDSGADRLESGPCMFGSSDTRDKISTDSSSDFEKVWAKKIYQEMELEKKALLSKSIKKITEVSYEQEEDKVVKVFVQLPEGYSGVRPAADDNIKLESKGWKLFGKIASCSGFKKIFVTITAKPNSLPAPPECENFTLLYVINDTNYKKMKEAVKVIAEAGEEGCEIASVITGSKLECSKNNFTVVDSARLDESQAEAVKVALDNRVSLIVGPYGCGKTSVTGSIISNLLSKSEGGKVLGVAPSNAATDNLTESLAEQGLKVLRIVAKSHESKIDSSMPISQHCLHAKLKLISYPDGATQSERNKLEAEESMKMVEEADIILSTCASSRMGVIKSVGKFSAIIMDESCQVKDKFGCSLNHFTSIKGF
jgi:hypothetical protein